VTSAARSAIASQTQLAPKSKVKLNVAISQTPTTIARTFSTGRSSCLVSTSGGLLFLGVHFFSVLFFHAAAVDKPVLTAWRVYRPNAAFDVRFIQPRLVSKGRFYIVERQGTFFLTFGSISF